MKTLLTIIIVLALVGLVYGDSDLDNRKIGTTVLTDNLWIFNANFIITDESISKLESVFGIELASRESDYSINIIKGDMFPWAYIEPKVRNILLDEYNWNTFKIGITDEAPHGLLIEEGVNPYNYISDIPNTISKNDSTDLADGSVDPAHMDSGQYRVTISITYNAVSPERAKQIAGESMTKHKDACKVDVNVSTVTDGTDGTD